MGSDMLDYATPRFKSSEVAKAAGVPLNTFRTLFKRGQFRMIGKTDAPASAHGLPHLFSLRDALGFAVAIELMRAGEDATRAWKIAMLDFAHTGDTVRDPGALFDAREHGSTFLLTWPGVDFGRVVSGNELQDRDHAHPILLLTPPGYQRRSTFRLTLLDDVERRVFLELEPKG